MAFGAGKHGIEPPSDGTLADLGKGQTGGRRKMFKRLGADMDQIVSNYGLGYTLMLLLSAIPFHSLNWWSA